MKVYLAYGLVVIIWSTTPLAIQWSNDSVSFIAAASFRMALAAGVAVILLAVLRRQLFCEPAAWRAYLVASIGIFPNMPLLYWSAQFIPSGLIAVLFALSPFVTGALSAVILGQNPFNRRRVTALLVALMGLLVIFWDQLQVGQESAYGIGGILLSCLLFSISSVGLKRLDRGTGPLEQTAGALLFAMPGLLLCWWLLDGQWPSEFSSKSLTGILYLATFGSLLGFTLFYYILGKLSPSAVSLITLMTPVLALLIGALFAGELVSFRLVVGATMVLVALLAYLDLGLERWWPRAKPE